MYLLSDAAKVINLLTTNKINCELIGNVRRIGYSEHDIDVWIKEMDTQQLHDKIISLLNPKDVLNTDWEGMYLKETIFGDVDIFLKIDNLDYL